MYHSCLDELFTSLGYYQSRGSATKQCATPNMIGSLQAKYAACSGITSLGYVHYWLSVFHYPLHVLIPLPQTSGVDDVVSVQLGVNVGQTD